MWFQIRSDLERRFRGRGRLLTVIIVRTIALLVITAATAELAARFAATIAPMTVYQPFLTEYRPCGAGCENPNDLIYKQTNERGAYGNMWTGEPIQIATLGSSTTASSTVSQDSTWPAALETVLGADVHVDNYGLNGGGNKEIEAILAHFVNSDIHYDIILVMDHWGHADRRVSLEAGLRYWGSFRNSDRWLATVPVFASPIKRQILSRLKSIREFAYLTRLDAPAPQRESNVHPSPLSRANRELRNTGQVTLVDVDIPPLSKSKKDYIRDRMQRLAALSDEIGAELFIVTQPMAYRHDELAGVAQRWFTLYPASNHPPTYRSNKTIYLSNRQKNEAVVEIGAQAGISVIDLDEAINPCLAVRDDLFYDKWHFAPNGGVLAGRILAWELMQDDQKNLDFTWPASVLINPIDGCGI